MDKEKRIAYHIYPSEDVMEKFDNMKSPITMNTISGKEYSYYSNWLDDWCDGRGVEHEYIITFFNILILQKKIKNEHCE